MDKIICVGKNYLEHAKEMKDPIPAQPVIFIKPPSVLKLAQQWGEFLNLKLPSNNDEIHYECELVFQIKASGYQLKNLSLNDAFSAVSIGLDMTNRTQQALAKAQGAPWTTGKVFPDAAVVGPWLSLSEFPSEDIHFSFSLNEVEAQQASSLEMRMSPLALLQYVSHFFPVCAGDLLFTGTPKGVGRVQHGDRGLLKLGQQSYSVQWT